MILIDVFSNNRSGGSTSQSQQRYCTCSSFYEFYEYSSAFNPNYAKCNLDAPTEPCSERSGQTVNVCSLGRRRRSTAGSDDVQDDINFIYDPEYDPTIQLNVSCLPSHGGCSMAEIFLIQHKHHTINQAILERVFWIKGG